MKPLQKVKRFVDVQKFNLWFKIHTHPVLPDPVTLIGVIMAETHPDTKSPFFGGLIPAKWPICCMGEFQACGLKAVISCIEDIMPDSQIWING